MFLDSKVSGVFTYAVTMIIALEQALPQAGLGATKKQIVLAGIETGLKATTVVSSAAGLPEIADLSALAESFIDETVNLLKKAKAGPFEQSGHSTAPAPANAVPAALI